MGKSDLMYDCPGETVPEQFFGWYVVVSYNDKAVRHILEPVHNMSCVKYHYQPLCPFIAELGQKHLLFAYVMVGH